MIDIARHCSPRPHHMKILSIQKWLKGCFIQPAAEENDDAERVEDWIKDPLAHPTLQTMTLDELSDLPFDPHTIRN
jgi:hypothetical protein